MRLSVLIIPFVLFEVVFGSKVDVSNLEEQINMPGHPNLAGTHEISEPLARTSVDLPESNSTLPESTETQKMHDSVPSKTPSVPSDDLGSTFKSKGIQVVIARLQDFASRILDNVYFVMVYLYKKIIFEYEFHSGHPLYTTLLLSVSCVCASKTTFFGILRKFIGLVFMIAKVNMVAERLVNKVYGVSPKKVEPSQSEPGVAVFVRDWIHNKTFLSLMSLFTKVILKLPVIQYRFTLKCLFDVTIHMTLLFVLTSILPITFVGLYILKDRYAFIPPVILIFGILHFVYKYVGLQGTETVLQLFEKTCPTSNYLLMTQLINLFFY